ncbi:unnamed protein product [Pieris macdunnoughi]|uniref:Uncharacterized protein n=1 Tax=Pieris macdunnoughi TaxID=345717 RepID=A0A821T507_9NEOP|nr:unnamed protein product [Pieris macdunnoughi]
MTSKSCTGSDPHVTRRLCATLMCLIGILCICAGYLFGRMARNEVRRGNDIISSNLTIAADKLFRKAKRISPKAVHHNDPGKMTLKILDIFHCEPNDCGSVANDNVADFIKTSINYEVNKLIRSIYNASLYLDSLR